MENKSENKRILTKKLLWFFLSLIGATLVWFYVTSTEIVVTTTFRNIPVVFVGEESLREQKGLVITNVSDSSITVRLSGPRRELVKLNENNLAANVDLSSVNSGTTTCQLSYVMSYPGNVNSSNIEVSMRMPGSISFNVEKLSSKTVELRGELAGSIAPGYTSTRELTFNPSTVKISGPDSVLSTVSYAFVLVERDNVDKTLSFDSSYELRNEEGDPVDMSKIRLEYDTVNVTLPVSMVKTVPLKVKVIDGGGATSENAVITIEPDSIDLTGDAAVLEGINNIEIGTVDLSDFELSENYEFNIVIDNELKNVTGATTAKVTVSIKGLETKKFTVTNVSTTNVAQGLLANVVTQSLEVIIRAKPSDLEQIQASNIRVVADMAEFTNTTGMVTPPVKISVDGFPDAGAVGDYSISVNMDKFG